MPSKTPTVINCLICGKPFPSNQIILNDYTDITPGAYIPACVNCSSLLHTCGACEYFEDCRFEKDHSMPHQVQRQIMKGPFVSTVTVKNPDLIGKHCFTCRCGVEYNGEVDCLRDSAQGQGLNCPHHKIAQHLLR